MLRGKSRDLRVAAFSLGVLKFSAMRTNELYMAVLPLIHLTDRFGMTEQVLTLLPSKDLATEFYPDEVEGYILTFQNRADKYLTGGHVKEGYGFHKETTEDGMVIVRVTQNVA
jgi:hypothetical protein